MNAAREETRNSILGADRVFRVVEGGGGGDGPAPPPADGDRGAPCPVQALGYDDRFHFLDVRGRVSSLTARQLGSRSDLLKLFLGDETWLRQRFPKKKNVDDGQGGEREVTVDFHVNSAVSFLMRECGAAGIMHDGLVLRRPGVWRDDAGLPIVHCGDEVMIDGEWYPAGTRTKGQIWAADGHTPRPGAPCDHNVGQQLQQDLQDYWSWRAAGSAIVIVGLIGVGYYGAATDWRTNGFITGGTGSGKTSARKVIRNAWPLHYYSNDTTKAGLEQNVAGRAMPMLIDEASDRRNPNAALDLVDLVLSASGDEGTKGDRGTVGGEGRRIEVAGSVVMFSINPPELQPQHLSRFVLVDLKKPDGGADYSDQHRRVADGMKKNGPALWGRAIASWERYVESQQAFRAELRRVGCTPREMDSKAALLAGWWVLTREGLPGERGAREGVHALAEFISTARQSAIDDGPRLMMQRLMSSLVTLHRSTDRDPIGTLLDLAFGDTGESDRMPFSANVLLGNYGMRPIMKCQWTPERRAGRQCGCNRCWDTTRKKAIPRGDFTEGVWFATQSPELNRLFEGTPFAGGKWRFEMMRLETARKSGCSVRIGGASGHAIWLSREDLHGPDDEPDEPP